MKSIEDYQREFKFYADRDSQFRLSPDIFEKTEEEFLAIDLVSNQFLKEFIADYGFPSVNLVGEQSAYYAWLLAQHSDFDVEFQKNFLEMMLEEPGPKDPILVGKLTDRVLKNSGLPQRYGTQFVREDNGEWLPYDLENPEKVDELRAQIGLYPIAEDLEFFNQK